MEQLYSIARSQGLNTNHPQVIRVLEMQEQLSLLQQQVSDREIGMREDIRHMRQADQSHLMMRENMQRQAALQDMQGDPMFPRQEEDMRREHPRQNMPWPQREQRAMQERERRDREMRERAMKEREQREKEMRERAQKEKEAREREEREREMNERLRALEQREKDLQEREMREREMRQREQMQREMRQREILEQEAKEIAAREAMIRREQEMREMEAKERREREALERRERQVREMREQEAKERRGRAAGGRGGVLNRDRRGQGVAMPKSRGPQMLDMLDIEREQLMDQMAKEVPRKQPLSNIASSPGKGRAMEGISLQALESQRQQILAQQQILEIEIKKNSGSAERKGGAMASAFAAATERALKERAQVSAVRLAEINQAIKRIHSQDPLSAHRREDPLLAQFGRRDKGDQRRPLRDSPHGPKSGSGLLGAGPGLLDSGAHSQSSLFPFGQKELVERPVALNTKQGQKSPKGRGEPARAVGRGQLPTRSSLKGGGTLSEREDARGFDSLGRGRPAGGRLGAVKPGLREFAEKGKMRGFVQSRDPGRQTWQEGTMEEDYYGQGDQSFGQEMSEGIPAESSKPWWEQTEELYHEEHSWQETEEAAAPQEDHLRWPVGHHVGERGIRGRKEGNPVSLAQGGRPGPVGGGRQNPAQSRQLYAEEGGYSLNPQQHYEEESYYNEAEYDYGYSEQYDRGEEAQYDEFYREEQWPREQAKVSGGRGRGAGGAGGRGAQWPQGQDLGHQRERGPGSSLAKEQAYRAGRQGFSMAAEDQSHQFGGQTVARGRSLTDRGRGQAASRGRGQTENRGRGQQGARGRGMLSAPSSNQRTAQEQTQPGRGGRGRGGRGPSRWSTGDHQDGRREAELAEYNRSHYASNLEARDLTVAFGAPQRKGKPMTYQSGVQFF